jgi:hypothetical protein
MATERVAPPLSGFFKFSKVGQSVAGRIDSIRTVTSANGPSTFAVLRPVLIHDGNKTNGSPLYERWESCALGLGADLRTKLSAKDEGLYVRVTYTGQEPTKKESPKRVFLVEIMEGAEMRELNDKAGKDHAHEPYFPAEAKGGTSSGADDESDDLPF